MIVEPVSGASGNPRRRVVISFEGTSVSVESDPVEVLEGVRDLYEAMIVEDTAEVAVSVHVSRSEHEYLIRTADEVRTALDVRRAVKRARYAVLEEFVRMRPEFMWLHAGAASSDRGAGVVFAGRWGSGKSSIVTRLSQLGYGYLSDDVVPYDPISDTIIPFPTTPAYRDASSEASGRLDRDRVAGLPKISVRLSPDAVASGIVHPRLVVFPEFADVRAPEFERLPPSVLALKLTTESFGLRYDEAATVRMAARLAASASGYRVRYSDVGDVVQQIVALLDDVDA